MELRNYKPEDCVALAELFFNTIHSINARDYTKPQLDAWATGNVDISVWNKSFLAHNTLVAEINRVIVGFGDMDDTGYLDKLFVHKDYQGKGVAAAIINKLEQQAGLNNISLFTTHASITAKPFFEKYGYRVIQENLVVRNDIKLTNFIMKKSMMK
ncbi:GNAT family N-acetyltransferase [uncultured Oscillibacter sp.]|uniref:GNAT family N-acetyltransferase n=1 Tax=uncultured Oscillibacter sp. TaxID=876091 RepID=UPI0025E5E1AB|nr:GNAT family N-acetyltransferase [uncultured Oscillibacter sp.]